MNEISKYNGLVAIHCENDELIKYLKKQIKPNKINKVINHSIVRQEITESQIIKNICLLAKITNCNTLIVYISSYQALKEVINAKIEGAKVYTETCP